jgi:hypothetical protein
LDLLSLSVLCAWTERPQAAVASKVHIDVNSAIAAEISLVPSSRQQDAVAYLIEESSILRGHVRGRLRLTDEEHRRLAMLCHRLGRRRLRDVAMIVTPDTIL